MRKINKRYLKQFLKSIENEELILDIDASFIEAHKNTTKWSYKDASGYMPMVGHINNGYVIDIDFREGNEAPASRNLEFVKQIYLTIAKRKIYSSRLQQKRIKICLSPSQVSKIKSGMHSQEERRFQSLLTL